MKRKCQDSSEARSFNSRWVGWIDHFKTGLWVPEPLTDAESTLLRGSHHSRPSHIAPTSTHSGKRLFVKEKPENEPKKLKHDKKILSCGLEETVRYRCPWHSCVRMHNTSSHTSLLGSACYCLVEIITIFPRE